MTRCNLLMIEFLSSYNTIVKYDIINKNFIKNIETNESR